MNCDKCNSDRVAMLNGKTADMCQFRYDKLDIDANGYVPKGIIIGDEYGDYIEFYFCLECGKIQGRFPISDSRVKKAVKEV